jgi:hypothetical protein
MSSAWKACTLPSIGQLIELLTSREADDRSIIAERLSFAVEKQLGVANRGTFRRHPDHDLFGLAPEAISVIADFGLQFKPPIRMKSAPRYLSTGRRCPIEFKQSTMARPLPVSETTVALKSRDWPSFFSRYQTQIG